MNGIAAVLFSPSLPSQMIDKPPIDSAVPMHVSVVPRSTNFGITKPQNEGTICLKSESPFDCPTRVATCKRTLDVNSILSLSLIFVKPKMDCCDAIFACLWLHFAHSPSRLSPAFFRSANVIALHDDASGTRIFAPFIRRVGVLQPSSLSIRPVFSTRPVCLASKTPVRPPVTPNPI